MPTAAAWLSGPGRPCWGSELKVEGWPLLRGPQTLSLLESTGEVWLQWVWGRVALKLEMSEELAQQSEKPALEHFSTWGHRKQAGAGMQRGSSWSIQGHAAGLF